MFGFLMGLMTFFQAGKKKIVDRSNQYKEKQKEYRQKMNKNLDLEEQGEEAKLKQEEKKKTKDKSKEESIKTRAMALFSAVVLFFESLPLFFSLIAWGSILLILAILIVIIFSFLATLQAAIAQEDEDRLRFQQDDTVVGAGCENVHSVGGILPWTEADLAARGTKLTDYEKNVYRLGILSREAIEGYGGKKQVEVGSDYLQTIMLLGIASIESQMQFFNDKNDNRDITKVPSNKGLNSSGYGYMGLHGNYSYTDKIPKSVRDNLAQKYKPQGSMQYDNQFTPWAMMLSYEHLGTKVSTVNTHTKGDKIGKILDEWGIKANKQEAWDMIFNLLLQAQYHGAFAADYDDYINYWAAMFYVTSENDAERTWDSWSYDEKAGYNESNVRYSFAGNSGFRSIIKKPIYLKLNGQNIGKPLPDYLEDKVGNRAGYRSAKAKVHSMGRAQRTQVLNFHYGINSYLQGKKVENMLASKMGYVGQPKIEVDCEVSSPRPGTFTPTPGQGQAIIDGKTTKEYLQEYYDRGGSKTSYIKGLEKFFGKSSYLEGNAKGEPVPSSSYVDEKHGVPFYGQARQYEEVYLEHPYVPGGNTYNISACMIYSYSYAASAMTGALINPAEMGALLHANNGFVGNLVYTDVAEQTLKKMGMQARSTNKWDGFDETLDKGGVIVIRTKPGPERFTSSEHFQVVTGVDIKDGTRYYHMYTSSSHTQSSVVYTMEQVKRNSALHRSNPLLHVWK